MDGRTASTMGIRAPGREKPRVSQIRRNRGRTIRPEGILLVYTFNCAVRYDKPNVIDHGRRMTGGLVKPNPLIHPLSHPTPEPSFEGERRVCAKVPIFAPSCAENGVKK